MAISVNDAIMINLGMEKTPITGVVPSADMTKVQQQELRLKSLNFHY